jgi:hypothetical protein
MDLHQRTASPAIIAANMLQLDFHSLANRSLLLVEKQQWFVVLNEEVVEPVVEFRDIDRDRILIGGDLRHSGHILQLISAPR